MGRRFRQRYTCSRFPACANPSGKAWPSPSARRPRNSNGDWLAVGDLAGAYSRRINIQHRLVYEVFPKERVVRVLRMWTHYE
ncbi:MAG: type II toxin-antitoxin system YoeB family toxin [Sterolibacteriaceae bacterium MAG5]|nr:type II toxin-antitoxin system YoeB family toxin [Candidatus Nitricoxidireducens bremensis]